MVKKFLARSPSGIKTALTFKLVFTLICSVIFIYQIVDLLTEYLSYNTIIVFENEYQSSEIVFPSVSVCEKYPKIGFINGSEVFKSRFPIGISIASLKYGRLKRGDNDVIGYIDFNNRIQEENSKNGRKYRNKTMKKAFGPFNDESIKCISISTDQKICHSRIHTASSVAQCRTFFGQIDSSGKVTKQVVRKTRRREPKETTSIMANFYINFTDSSYDNILKKGDIFVVLHESKSHPEDKLVAYASRRFLIKNNRNYDLIFHKKSILRLPKPYKTDCHLYEEEVNSSNIYGLSRELCLLKCRTERIRSKFDCLRYTSETIFEDQFSDSKICNISVHLNLNEDGIYYFEAIEAIKCFQECKAECVQEVYSFDLHEVDRSDGDLINYNIYKNATNSENISLVSLIVRGFDEISYIHLPKMRFTDFWSSFGGLLGLWLGLSVLAIYDNIIAFCILIFAKF
jgi:hypothetical protein